MTNPDAAAVQVALAYHQAWTSQDFEQAMTYIDPHITCDAPPGRLEGADSFRAFMGPFAGIATSSRLIAAFGDAGQAVVMYDTATRAVPNAPGAEYVTVTGGRITYMRIVFDRLPFEAARQAAAPS
jgi:SnoaL-like protein